MSITRLNSLAIPAGTVEPSDISNNSITTDKIANTAVTDAKLHTTLDLSSKTLTGDVTFTNNVAATYFTGDGSALTGIEALPSSIFANGSATANTLHIAANSNIGIGTVSPAAKLQVDGSVVVLDGGAAAVDLRNSSNVAYLTGSWTASQNYQPSNSDLIQVKNYETGVDDIFAGIWFETGTPATNTTGERTGRIALVPQNDASYGANFTFSTRRAATAGLTETMRLTHNGDMLVGTSTESGARLHVENDSGTIATFKRTNGDWAYVYIEAGSTVGNSRLYFSDGAGAEGGIDYEHSTDDFRLFSANTFTFTASGNQGLQITSLGNIYVGSTSSSGLLILNGQTAGNEGGQLNLVCSGSQGTYSIDTYTDDMRFLMGPTAGQYKWYANNNSKIAMSLTAAGALSVGNTSPSTTVRLKVQGTATNTETAVEFFKIGTTANYNASIMKLWANNSYGDSTVTEIKLDALNGFKQYNADDPGNLADGSWYVYSNGAFGGDSYLLVQPYGGGEMRGVGGGSANFYVQGTLSKGAGSFRIPHPLISKRGTHRLVHSFAESPGADLFYSGMVNLVDGEATINIDTEAGMTEGTFVELCREVRRHCTNESGFTAVKSSIANNILTIIAEDPTCTDEVFWMVVGERQDPTIYESTMTDDNGKVIVEPLIAAEA